MLGVETHNGEFSLACGATVVTGTSRARSDDDCRKRELSMNRERAGLCPACRSAGLAIAPIDCPGLESYCWCSDCETGRRFIHRITEIVVRDLAEERARRNV
jgi:hypothetical protein